MAVGSVLHQEMTSNARAKEIHVLKLYNRHRRAEDFLEKLVTNYLHFSKQQHHHACTEPTRPACQPHTVASFQPFWPDDRDPSNNPDHLQDEAPKVSDSASAHRLPSSRGPGTIPREDKVYHASPRREKRWSSRKLCWEVASFQAARTRARGSVLIQMYNNRSGDAGINLASLEPLFRQRSIANTGWTTVGAVSDALRRVGVTIADRAILLLADRIDTNDTFLGQQALEGSVYLVFWPIIFKFLLQDPRDPIEKDDELVADDSSCKNSFGLPVDQRASNRRLPGKRGTPKGGIAAHSPPDKPMCSRILRTSDIRPSSGTNQGDCPEITPDPLDARTIGFVDGGNRTNNRPDANCGAIPREADGRRPGGSMHGCREGWSSDTEAGLRAADQSSRRLSTGRSDEVSDETDKSVSRVNKLPTETNDGDEGHDRENYVASETAEGNIEDGRQGDIHIGVNGDDEAVAAIPAELPVSCCREQDPGTTAACDAGKRGDVDALKILCNHVDLRTKDGFGRNALYYACLCGHVAAVRFVAIRAYEGVEGIPKDELWECRKNALSNKVRHLLDVSVALIKSDSRPHQRNEKQTQKAEGAAEFLRMSLPAPKSYTVIPTDGTETRAIKRVDGEDKTRGREVGGAKNARHLDVKTVDNDSPSRAEEVEGVFSIAFLFGCGLDSPKDDY